MSRLILISKEHLYPALKKVKTVFSNLLEKMANSAGRRSLHGASREVDKKQQCSKREGISCTEGRNRAAEVAPICLLRSPVNEDKTYYIVV